MTDKLEIDPFTMELPLFSPEELLGLTFLKECEDGQTLRAKVLKHLNE